MAVDERDDGLMLIVPPLWEVWGRLPSPDFAVFPTHERMRWLVTGLVEIVSADGQWLLTVDWHPPGDLFGAFRCRLAHYHDAAHPLEEHLFETVASVRHWLQRTVDHLL